MNPRIKKIIDMLFSFLFVVIITIPLICMNREGYVESKLENRVLTSWPGWGFSAEYNEWYGHYAEDRIGFREEAIVFFTKLTHSLFHEFSEEMHMYGKDGYVFPADEGYVQSYQHLNTDEELVDSLVTYLENTNEYLSAKGIPFVFMVCLDKKSVYGDYFPDYIHVDEKAAGTLELLQKKLDEAHVPYVIPVDEFTKEAKVTQLYNQKYDCAHWNDFGALFGLKLVGEKFKELGSSAPVLSEEDYQLDYEEMVYMEFVDIPIHEQVPYYTLKQKPKLKSNDSLKEALLAVEGTSIQHYKNPNAKSNETILIFHDSFLQDNKKFFVDIYKEVYMISRQNYEGMQYYVNVLQPDLVLYENAERAFADDLYAYTRLGNIEYEMPYGYTACRNNEKVNKNTSGQNGENGLCLNIIEAEGATLKENILTFRKDSGIVVLKGELAASNLQDYDIYVKYKGKYYEAGYEVPWQENDHRNNVYAAFRSNRMKEGIMEFIAVSKETGQEFSLLSIKVQKQNKQNEDKKQ